MKLKTLSVATLIPFDKNPRKIDPFSTKKLEESLNKWGYVDPIIVNETNMEIIHGHQRFIILQKQGVTDVECSVVTLSEKEGRALGLAMNKIHGEFDTDLLAEVLHSLGDPDLQITTGFTDRELEILIARATEDAPNLDEMAKEHGVDMLNKENISTTLEEPINLEEVEDGLTTTIHIVVPRIEAIHIKEIIDIALSAEDIDCTVQIL